MKVCYSVGKDDNYNEICENIYFTGINSNYGGAKRTYFLCPFCGRRCCILYMRRRHFKCRLCAKLNYYSQQVTKGIDQAAYKMEQFIKNKFGVKERIAPVDAARYIPNRPKGMHIKTYRRLLAELLKLQDSYNRKWLGAVRRILK